MENSKSQEDLSAEIVELKRTIHQIEKHLPHPDDADPTQIQERIGMLAARSSILAVCNTSRDAREILLTCFYELVNILDIRTGLLHFADDASGVLFLKAHENINASLQQKVETIESGTTPVGQAAKTHRPVFIESVEKFGGRVKPFWENEEIKSGVSIPLIGPYGLICILTFGSDKPGFFTEHRMNYISSATESVIASIGMLRKIEEDPDMVSDIKTRRSPVSRVIEAMPEGVILADRDGVILTANSALVQLAGYSAADITGQAVADLIPGWIDKDRFSRFIGFTRQIEEKKSASTGPVALFDRKKREYFGNITVDFIDSDESRNPVGCIIVVAKAAEPIASGKAFINSENLMQTLIRISPSGTIATDLDGTVTHATPGFLTMYGIQTENEITGTHLLELIAPEDRVKGIHMLDGIRKEGIRQDQPLALQKKNGARFTGTMRLDYIKDGHGNPRGMLAVISTVPQTAVSDEDRDTASETIRDRLTGFYSRSYFNDELERLGRDVARLYPLAIFVVEVHGIELINEIFGSDTGDDLLVTAGEILSKPFRRIDTPARINGKRFGIILPRTPVGVAKAKKDIILTKTAKYNAQKHKAPLSLSIGFAATEDIEDGTIYDLFHRSVVDLEEERLALNMSPGQKILQILMENLEEKGFISSDSESPLWKATQKVLSKAELPDNEIKNLQLMVRAHNMGYIIVPDPVWEKPDTLTAEELEAVKQHPQIGCNIAIQSVEFAPVATQILHHHERWDGNGYPAGLKGKRIPRECRIFSILDAYGAMVSPRSFRREKSHQQALNEIMEESGSQFDPDVAEEIVDILK